MLKVVAKISIIPETSKCFRNFMMRIGVFGPDFMENGGSVRSYGATVCCYRATIFSYRGSVAENGGTIRMNSRENPGDKCHRISCTQSLPFLEGFFIRARICVHAYIVAILAFYVSHLSHLSLFRKTTGTHGTDGTLVFGFNLLPRAGAKDNPCGICPSEKNI